MGELQQPHIGVLHMLRGGRTVVDGIEEWDTIRCKYSRRRGFVKDIKVPKEETLY